MRTMIDLGTGQHNLIMDTATSVDCSRQIKYRRSFRTLIECIVPTCCGNFPPPKSENLATTTDHGASTVTATFFGHRKGRVSFCIQDDIKRAPLLLLDFAVPTSYLAREMQYGLLRITLESDRRRQKLEGAGDGGCSLYDVPVWCMYCNGRKVGFAIRRVTTRADVDVLKVMRAVSVGAGVIPAVAEEEDDGELMYLRARFDRVVGSVDSESFHMINPVGSSGQELSVFFLRT
ncbi:hypothetical protein ACJIZ3_003340 [Penstemon smallii]|uniref:Protein MIZU-KUSSEI 1 n=1 Tax=Penstemon smallii TaxID=265156 RepID=A0ABD3UA64_9LAMI